MNLHEGHRIVRDEGGQRIQFGVASECKCKVNDLHNEFIISYVFRAEKIPCEIQLVTIFASLTPSVIIAVV